MCIVLNFLIFEIHRKVFSFKFLVFEFLRKLKTKNDTVLLELLQKKKTRNN